MNMLGVGLLGAAKGGAEEYLDIKKEDRATERDVAKEQRAQDMWDLRQKRLDEYGIAGEKRKAITAEETEKRKSGLVEGREIAKEKRDTKRGEREAGQIRGAMDESRPRVEAEPDYEGESIGPPQIGDVDEEAAAGLLTQKGYPDLAKSVRESKGKATSATSSADERMAEVYAKEKGWSMGEALDYVSQQKRENPKKAALEWVKIRQKEQSDNSVYKEIRKGVPNPAYKTAEQLRDEAMDYFGGAKKPGAKGDMLGKPPAADHKGRTIIDSETGVQYKSNGSKWVKVG